MVREKSLVAGGCFWCIQSVFASIPGILSTVVGYTGGTTPNPTYREVTSGITGHQEAVEIIFDPEKISYSEILDIFWRQIDPTDEGGQFADRGSSYHTAIFFLNAEQKRVAEESKKMIGKCFNKPIATKIVQATHFYPAEEYHQDYYQKNPEAYQHYVEASGRKEFLKKHWQHSQTSSCPVYEGQDLNAQLNSMQYKVTQQGGTEPPFDNSYWDHHAEGIYVDLISGEPLFSSVDKYDSGTGWPSFTKPLEKENLIEKKDESHGMSRVEVRSHCGNSHLGHLFTDGPQPTGLRYCINSAALRFIPKEDLEKEGYAQYKALFKKSA